VVLLYHIVEVLNAPQLAVTGKDSLFDGGGESFWVGGVLVCADGKRQGDTMFVPFPTSLATVLLT
jgi:hypothetical protein